MGSRGSNHRVTLEQIQSSILSVKEIQEKDIQTIQFDQFNVQGYYILPIFILKMCPLTYLEQLLEEFGDPVYLYPCKSTNRFRNYGQLYRRRVEDGYEVDWDRRELLLPDLVIIDNVDGGDISVNIKCNNTTVEIYCGDRFLYPVLTPLELRRLGDYPQDFVEEAQKWLGLMTAPGWRRSKRKV